MNNKQDGWTIKDALFAVVVGILTILYFIVTLFMAGVWMFFTSLTPRSQ